MKVVLFFFNPECRTRETVAYGMYGRYNIGGFMFVRENRVESFYTSLGGTFAKHEIGRRGVDMPGNTDYLLLPVDDEEMRRILATCEACVTVRKPFNFKDVLLMYVPFREVEDLPIENAPTLNNTQAIILILRECLNTDNRLREGVEGLHSRQTFLEDLYIRLLPLAVQVSWSNISALVRWCVEDRAQKSDA